MVLLISAPWRVLKLDSQLTEAEQKELDHDVLEFFGDYVDDPPRSRIAKMLRMLVIHSPTFLDETYWQIDKCKKLIDDSEIPGLEQALLDAWKAKSFASICALRKSAISFYDLCPHIVPVREKYLVVSFIRHGQVKENTIINSQSYAKFLSIV
jgi:hypothetical protein